jgi:peptidoglycan hydrolase-like protein with peptidoglycan-binding domain
MKKLYFSFILIFALCILFTGEVRAQTSGPQQPGSEPLACYVFKRDIVIGTTGPDVTALQTLLISLGQSIPDIESGKVAKGKFGNQTAEALRTYQKKTGLKVTGIMLANTRDHFNTQCKKAGVTVKIPPSAPLKTLSIDTILMETGGFETIPADVVANSPTSTVVVIVPNGREIWSLGSEQTLTWRTAHTFNYRNPILFDLFLDRTSCAAVCSTQTYTVARALTNVTAYKWSVGKTLETPAAPEGFYRLRTCSYSEEGTHGCDISNAVFTITAKSSVPPTTKAVTCPAGYVCDALTIQSNTILKPIAVSVPAPTAKPVIENAKATPMTTPKSSSNGPTFIPWHPTTPLPAALPSSKPAPPVTKAPQPPVNPSANDRTPPVISALIEENLSRGMVSIQWTTNEIATSQVEYGTTPSYGKKTAQNRGFSLYHSALLTNLSDNTTYYYRVISKDEAGNTKTSSGYSFRTSPAPSSYEIVPSPTPYITPYATPAPTLAPTPTPSVYESPISTPEASPVSVVPVEFNQTATLWDATLMFFGAK